MSNERRLAFGEVAEQYDRARSSYPSALVDEVLAFAGIGRGGRALEVGAGTGKATVLLAARGIAIHALEPSAEMARVARANCAAYPAVTIEEREFEQATLAPGSFDLVFSAQAWHWTDPETRYQIARSALTAGGALAVFWNRPRWEESPLRGALQAAYDRTVPDFGGGPGPMYPHTGPPRELFAGWRQEFAGTTGFREPQERTYEWVQEYAAAAYVELLGTHSDHIILAPSRRQALLDEVRASIEAGGGTLSLNYETLLCMARAAA